MTADALPADKALYQGQLEATARTCFIMMTDGYGVKTTIDLWALINQLLTFLKIGPSQDLEVKPYYNGGSGFYISKGKLLISKPFLYPASHLNLMKYKLGLEKCFRELNHRAVKVEIEKYSLKFSAAV